MSVEEASVRRLPLTAVPQTSSKDFRQDYVDFLTRLSVYDTIGLDISDDMKTMISKKKEREILDYISTFHPHAVSRIGGNGRFAGQWRTTVGHGRDGTVTKRAKTLDELLEMLAEIYGLPVNMMKEPVTRMPTLETYFPHWLEWKGKRNNNKSCTMYHNQVDFEKYVKGTALAGTPLDKITPEMLDDWARDLLIRKPLNASRFNTYKIVVKGPLELAVREKLISASPWKREFMDYSLLLKSSRKAPSKKKIFYDDEIKKIVTTCMEGYNSTHNSANIAIIINFDLGLRVSELSALKWSDIDWKNQTVFIQRQESERKVEDYVKSDSSSGYRELPLNSQVLGLLERLRQDFGNVSEFIFTDEDGNRKSSSALQKRLIYAQVGKNGDKADSEVKRSHCQRRTVGTRIANQCGLEAARQWLGHTDLQTTLRYIYSTETLDTLRGFSESTSAIRVLNYENRPEKDAV